MKKYFEEEKYFIIATIIFFIITLYVKIINPKIENFQSACGVSSLILSMVGIGFFLSFIKPYRSKRSFINGAKELDKKYSFFLDLWLKKLPEIEMQETEVRDHNEKIMSNVNTGKELSDLKSLQTQQFVYDFRNKTWDLFKKMYKKKLLEKDIENDKNNFFEACYNNRIIEEKLIILYLFFNIKDNQIQLRKEAGI